MPHPTKLAGHRAGRATASRRTRTAIADSARNTSYQVEAKCAQFLTASLKHAYTWATDTWFTSGIGFRSPSSEQYYDAFTDTSAGGALEDMSDHISRPSAQRVSDLHAGSVIAVKYLDGSEGGASGHMMVVQSVAPFERDGNSATQEYAVRVADSTSAPHGVASSSRTSLHWAFKDSRVEGSPGQTTKEWSGAGRGTIFIQADTTTGKPTGYWWGRNEAAFNTIANRPMVFVEADIPLGVIAARMLPSRTTGDLIDGHWRLLAAWGAVPKTLVWDNEAGVGRGRLTAEFAAFAGLLATKIHLCRPRDPEAKGLVERANGYLETSFLLGRTFSGPGDFNTQLTTWLAVANRRVHRTLQTRPTERWEADRAGMLTPPPVDPPAWWRMQTRIGRDPYVRVDTNDYSVHPNAIGRIVTVLTDNDEVLALAPGGVIVARHPRCWARHQTITDPDHAEAGKTRITRRRGESTSRPLPRDQDDRGTRRHPSARPRPMVIHYYDEIYQGQGIAAR
ncbi:hypothetical protein ACFVW1_15275 [Streptomyces olivochromogenes]|uniref:Mu transposase domain-containing protein n=1 Tax=Streptomyces olivochromogenes TaxID=1963 RepID=UPI0036DBE8E6